MKTRNQKIWTFILLQMAAILLLRFVQAEYISIQQVVAVFVFWLNGSLVILEVKKAGSPPDQEEEGYLEHRTKVGWVLLILSGAGWFFLSLARPGTLFEPKPGFILLLLALLGISLQLTAVFRTAPPRLRGHSISSFVLLVCAALILIGSGAKAALGSTLQASYRNCYDGDTCWFDVPGMKEPQKVRVVGVDTPELDGRCAEETFVAGVAKRYAKRLLVGAKRIELERQGRDRYGRLLARVIFDGRDLAQKLIEEKLGRPYSGGPRKPWCPEQR